MAAHQSHGCSGSVPMPLRRDYICSAPVHWRGHGCHRVRALDAATQSGCQHWRQWLCCALMTRTQAGLRAHPMPRLPLQRG
jgi:hypothetical protein